MELKIFSKFLNPIINIFQREWKIEHIIPIIRKTCKGQWSAWFENCLLTGVLPDLSRASNGVFDARGASHTQRI